MKKIRKVAAFLATAALLCFVPACGDRENGGGGGEDITGGSLNVVIFDGGYSTVWLENIAKSYGEIYGTKVTVRETPSNDETSAQISGGTLKDDIAFIMSNDSFKWGPQGKIADLTSVYNTTPEGETKPIKEKINQKMRTYYNQGGKEEKYYQMSWADSKTGLVYNKSTLDALFPDGYTLPRTTNELVEFSENIVNAGKKDTYAFAFSTGQNYLDYLFMTWWGQYSGYDEFKDFFAGYYTDSNGIRKFAENGEIVQNKGREKSMEVVERITSKKYGLTHINSDEMNYTEAQAAFLGEGWNDNTKKVAMMANGDWLENEMSKNLDRNPQDIRFMKMPIISSIIDRCPNIKDEETLRQVIDYVDGVEGAEKPLTVRDEDVEIIAEARNVVYSLGLMSVAVVPSNSKNIARAKNFLSYVFSDQGQNIYAQALKGATMPYGFDPTSDPTIQLSEFQKSKREVFDDRTDILVYNDLSAPLVSLAGLKILGDRGSHIIYGNLFAGNETAQDIIGSADSYITRNWKEWLNKAGIK